MKNTRVDIDIIYEDNHLLAAAKPHGMLTQSQGQEEGLESRLRLWLKNKYNKPGKAFLHALHRLDRPASGIVLFCKTSKALSRLQKDMRERNIKKYYAALVRGSMVNKEDFLIHYIKHGNKKAWVKEESDYLFKEAKLHYQCVQAKSPYFLLKVCLFTGRYHQIRAQLAHKSLPILGDTLYGCEECFFDQKGSIALHHTCMIINHPITKEKLNLEYPYPEKWLQIFS